MNVLVAGGRLQGVEAAYLAAAAGYDCTVMDKDGNAPAADLCGRFVQGDMLDSAFLAEQCRGMDLIVPACEEQPVLNALERASAASGVPLVYDRAAYTVSSSKRVSDKLFAELGIPAPLPWPDCGFPVLAKPSGESGSQGVRLLREQWELARLLEQHESGQLVLQQYIEGPSYSIEVVGDGERFAALQTTELFMDDVYDCKQVLAPAGLEPSLEEAFRRTALQIARALRIRGIFDVEAILHDGKMKILEIDARLPSQTPTAVYHSTGINMLELLAKTAQGRPLDHIPIREERACLYEHIHVKDGAVRVLGEHCMGAYGRLRIAEGFCGADIALTSHRPGRTEWVATLIFQGASREAVLERHARALRDAVQSTAGV